MMMLVFHFRFYVFEEAAVVSLFLYSNDPTYRTYFALVEYLQRAGFFYPSQKGVGS